VKAFFYTLILAAVLVGATIFLRSLGPVSPPPETVYDRQPIASSPPLAAADIGADQIQGYGIEELRKTGEEFLEQWHYPEAAKVFAKVVEQDSTDISALIAAVECYGAPDYYDEAALRRSLVRAMNSAAERDDSILVSAMADYYLGSDYESAATKLERLLENNPGDVDERLALARVYLELGRFGRVKQELKRVLGDDESHGRARELLVRCFASEGDFEEAERKAKDLAGIYPGEPFPYVLLARVELALGRSEDAFAFCRNALYLDSRYVPAILTQGYLYAARNDLEAARVSFEKLLLFADPSLTATAHEAIAYTDFLAGRFDEAKDELDEAIRQALTARSGRRAFRYLFELVDYLCELGQGEDAESVLDKWQGNFGAIPLELCKLRLDLYYGEMKRANHVLDKIRGEKDWRRWLRAIDVKRDGLAALASIKESKFEKAIKALSRRTPSPDDYYFLGFAFYESGEAEKAATYFTKAVSERGKLEYPYHWDPVRYVQSFFYLGEAAAAKGDMKKAGEFYERFLAHWDDASWELGAVQRAREKMKALSSIQP
jgi:tetratricopeptide (TPR) repeat protein